MFRVPQDVERDCVIEYATQHTKPIGGSLRIGQGRAATLLASGTDSRSMPQVGEPATASCASHSTNGVLGLMLQILPHWLV